MKVLEDNNIVIEIETQISTILEELDQLAKTLEECKNVRGWTSFSDPLSGRVCKVDEALKHIYVAQAEIAAIDIYSCEIEK